MKTSRLMARLDDEIARAGTQHDADCKQAERAVYLARLGQTEDARAVAAALHQRYDAQPHVEISVWIHLVEGLIGHFSDMDPGARQKIQRAHALSVAANLKRLRALSAAWLAHMEYARADVDALKKHVGDALSFASATDDASLARASLVVAQTLHYAGRSDLARRWYAYARDHAIVEGDDLTTSALMHNMAWLRSLDCRRGMLGGSAPSEDAKHALLSAQSVAHFDLLIGSVSLKSLIPILTAQILSARDRPAEALQIYEANLAATLAEGMNRLQADLLADQAWCRWRLGQVDRARSDALAAEECIDPKGYTDDRALAHGRLAFLFFDMGDAARNAHHSQLAAAAWSEHADLQSRMVEAFREVRHPIYS